AGARARGRRGDPSGGARSASRRRSATRVRGGAGKLDGAHGAAAVRPRRHDVDARGGGSLGFGVGAAIGAKIAVGRERPVICHLGDGALGYSAIGFWTLARYRTAMLIVVSNNESYQIVRHNWANQMPDSKMVRDGKYPGLTLGS